MRDAMRTLRRLYGEFDVRDLGPLAIKAVRTHMIEVEKLSRGVINSRVNRIRRIFKWAVSEELIPVASLLARCLRVMSQALSWRLTLFPQISFQHSEKCKSRTERLPRKGRDVL